MRTTAIQDIQSTNLRLRRVQQALQDRVKRSQFMAPDAARIVRLAGFAIAAVAAVGAAATMAAAAPIAAGTLAVTAGVVGLGGNRVLTKALEQAKMRTEAEQLLSGAAAMRQQLGQIYQKVKQAEKQQEAQSYTPGADLQAHYRQRQELAQAARLAGAVEVASSSPSLDRPKYEGPRLG